MSLRSTISLALFGMLLVVGIVASASAYFIAVSEAGQFMDDQMHQIAAVIDERTRPGAIGTLQEPEDKFAVTVWTADHRRVVLSEPAEETEPATFGFSKMTRSGESWRTYATRNDGHTVFVAQRFSARHEIAAHTAAEVALPILATVPLAWLIVTAVVQFLLRPTIELGHQIEERGIALERLSTTGLPRELLPFVIAINGLVGRLQAALDQQRRFIADSAHQLRTPLAAMRLQIDNLQDLGLPEASTKPLRAGMLRVSSLLNQLLGMARFDAQEPAGAPEIVDLGALLTQCVADRIALAEERGVDLGLNEIVPTAISAVPSDLVLILDNVIDNAVRYTPTGGRVDCSLVPHTAGTVALIVEDTGPGVPPEELSRVTERFFRGSNVDTLGSGLGLAIVQAAADRNRLRLSIANREGATGLLVRIVVPRA